MNSNNIFKIKKQDVNCRPSLKGSCGCYAIESQGVYIIKKTKKELEKFIKYNELMNQKGNILTKLNEVNIKKDTAIKNKESLFYVESLSKQRVLLKDTLEKIDTDLKNLLEA